MNVEPTSSLPERFHADRFNGFDGSAYSERLARDVASEVGRLLYAGLVPSLDQVVGELSRMGHDASWSWEPDGSVLIVGAASRLRLNVDVLMSWGMA